VCRTIINGYQGTALQRWVRPFSSDSGMIALAETFPFMSSYFGFSVPCFGTPELSLMIRVG